MSDPGTLCPVCRAFPCTCTGASSWQPGAIPTWNVGWRCPSCGAGNAPSTPRCACVPIAPGAWPGVLY